MPVLHAPAKVNLFLGVGARRTDGYHDVSTVLHALEFGDSVTVEPSDALSVECDVDLGIAPQSNLAHRAAVALGASLGIAPNVRILIEKRIPHGAGLGGGSSDAASVISGLCALWGIDPVEPRCVEVAASLGADVPFFLDVSGAALMGGRGDVREATLPSLSGAPVVLVKPQASVPTARAYAEFDKRPLPVGEVSAVCEALRRADVPALAHALSNNMEDAACTVVPAIREVLLMLRSQEGVLGASVAGSGSATFALTSSGESAQAIAQGARERGMWALATRLG